MGYTDKEYFLAKISEEDLNILIGATEGDTGELNLRNAISSADSLIDSYLRVVVSVPVDTPPEVIKQLSYDIAVFYLHDRIQYKDIPERVRDKYDAAINFLKDIGSGKASLNLPAESTSTKEDIIETGSNDRQMGRDMF